MTDCLLESYYSDLDDVGSEKLLTRKEELVLIKRIRGGDTAAKEQLMVANLRLVVSIAHKFKRTSISVMDLIQEGNIALLRAIDGFDPTRGVKFSHFAYKAIENAFKDILKAQPTEAPLSLDLEYVDAETTTLKDSLADTEPLPADITTDKDTVNQLKEVLKTLNAVECHAILMTSAGFAHQEIAATLGVAPETVKLAAATGLRKLAHPSRMRLVVLDIAQ